MKIDSSYWHKHNVDHMWICYGSFDVKIHINSSMSYIIRLSNTSVESFPCWTDNWTKSYYSHGDACIILIFSLFQLIYKTTYCTPYTTPICPTGERSNGLQKIPITQSVQYHAAGLRNITLQKYDVIASGYQMCWDIEGLVHCSGWFVWCLCEVWVWVFNT